MGATVLPWWWGHEGRVFIVGGNVRLQRRCWHIQQVSEGWVHMGWDMIKIEAVNEGCRKAAGALGLVELKRVRRSGGGFWLKVDALF